jgi:hypothetical protein
MKSDLTSEFAKLAPWVFRFRSDGHDHGGATSAVGDVQVERFFSLDGFYLWQAQNSVIDDVNLADICRRAVR